MHCGVLHEVSYFLSNKQAVVRRGRCPVILCYVGMLYSYSIVKLAFGSPRFHGSASTKDVAPVETSSHLSPHAHTPTDATPTSIPAQLLGRVSYSSECDG